MKKKTFRTNRKKLHLTCKVCGKDWVIQTSSPELYTEEIRKNWVCLICQKRQEGNGR